MLRPRPDASVAAWLKPRKSTMASHTGATGSKNQCGTGWQPARRLVTAAGPPRRRQGPIANRPQVTNQVTNLPHKISSANRRPLSFSWDFAGRRPIQTDHEKRWSVLLAYSFLKSLSKALRASSASRDAGGPELV